MNAGPQLVSSRTRYSSHRKYADKRMLILIAKLPFYYIGFGFKVQGHARSFEPGPPKRTMVISMQYVGWVANPPGSTGKTNFNLVILHNNNNGTLPVNAVFPMDGEGWRGLAGKKEFS